MNKKIAVPVITFAAFLAFSSTSFALMPPKDEWNTKPVQLLQNREELREQFKNKTNQKPDVIFDDVNPEEVRERAREQLQQNQEQVFQRLKANCENIYARVGEIMQKHQERDAKHEENLNKVLERLDNAIAKLSAQGYDTSALEEDRVILAGMIDEYGVLMDELSAEINSVYTDFSCENIDESSNPAEVVQMVDMSASKQKVAEVRAKAKEIRTFYVEVVRKDIVDLRRQIEEDMQETEETMEDSETAN